MSGLGRVNRGMYQTVDGGNIPSRVASRSRVPGSETSIIGPVTWPAIAASLPSLARWVLEVKGCRSRSSCNPRTGTGVEACQSKCRHTDCQLPHVTVTFLSSLSCYLRSPKAVCDALIAACAKQAPLEVARTNTRALPDEPAGREFRLSAYYSLLACP
jgi:hypothetical protein